MNYRTSWLINQGRFEEAEALVEQAYAYGIGVVPFAEMICRGQRYWSKSSRGADVDHPQNASEIEGLIRTSNLPRDVHEIFSVIMRYSYDHDGASAHERIRGVDYRKIERDEHWLLCITSLADIAVDVGDQDMARWLYRALMPYADLIAIHDLMRIGRGSVGFTLGLLAVALGEPDAAVGHFERAIAVEEAADMRLGRITSQVGLAGALGRRSAVGDEARARDLLQAARIAGERLALGEGCRVMRFLLARGDENPFDSDAWRRIQAS